MMVCMREKEQWAMILASDLEKKRKNSTYFGWCLEIYWSNKKDENSSWSKGY